MKHRTFCIDCRIVEEASFVCAVGEVSSELIAVCRCPKGHITISGLMHDQFDVLYTSAIQAFLSSFYSESIMSFTASLERLYEQYVKLFLHSSDIPFELIDSYWKELNNQSERQYGAFCTVFFIAENQPWTSDQKQISFRNRVIHKGHIAAKEESKYYAEYVTDKLNLIMKSIKTHFAKEKEELYFHIKKSSKPAIKKVIAEYDGAKFAATSYPSSLKWDYSEHEDANFVEAIAKMESYLGL